MEYATAQLAREHNLANVAAIGARMHTQRQALEIVLTFCNTKAGTEERHIRRITQIEMYESAKTQPRQIENYNLLFTHKSPTRI